MALSRGGRVYSWGSNLRGQLGVGSTGSTTGQVQRALHSPALVKSIKRRVAQIKCGAFHTAALLASGSLYTWGSGEQLGLGVFTGRGDRFVPTCVRKLMRHRLRSISCGPTFSAAVTHDGDVFTWGNGEFGQLGLGDRRTRFLPAQVEYFAGLKIKI